MTYLSRGHGAEVDIKYNGHPVLVRIPARMNPSSVDIVGSDPAQEHMNNKYCKGSHIERERSSPKIARHVAFDGILSCSVWLIILIRSRRCPRHSLREDDGLHEE